MNTDPHVMMMIAGRIRAVYTTASGRRYYLVDGTRQYL